MPSITPLNIYIRRIAHLQRPRPCPNHLPRQHHHHNFHTTAPLRADPTPDYYATLNLPPSATPADVKKSFYALSKLHHPDHNPTNQEAAGKKFVAIAEAYAVLGNATKRAQYDREHARFTNSTQPRGGPYSYSSSNASGGAGGRTASGLSRRRGQFKGPPPSFYRSGGWGAYSAKRQANAFNSAEGEGGRGSGGAPGADAQGRTHAGSTEDWPFGSDPNDVPHFDRGAHYRSQTSVEEQLRQGRHKRRASWDNEPSGSEGDSGFAGTMASFGMVGAVMVLGLSLPMFLFYRDDHDRGRKKGRERP